MKHRNFMPQNERNARSKVVKLLHDTPFIMGAVVTSERTCGKSRCKCMRGQKHLASYLSVRYKDRRKMICIPKQLEKEVFSWVKNYKEIVKQMDVISHVYVERIGKSRASQKGE